MSGGERGVKVSRTRGVLERSVYNVGVVGEEGKDIGASGRKMRWFNLGDPQTG